MLYIIVAGVIVVLAGKSAFRLMRTTGSLVAVELQDSFKVADEEATKLKLEQDKKSGVRRVVESFKEEPAKKSS